MTVELPAEAPGVSAQPRPFPSPPLPIRMVTLEQLQTGLWAKRRPSKHPCHGTQPRKERPKGSQARQAGRRVTLFLEQARTEAAAAAPASSWSSASPSLVPKPVLLKDQAVSTDTVGGGEVGLCRRPLPLSAAASLTP